MAKNLRAMNTTIKTIVINHVTRSATRQYRMHLIDQQEIIYPSRLMNEYFTGSSGLAPVNCMDSQ